MYTPPDESERVSFLVLVNKLRSRLNLNVFTSRQVMKYLWTKLMVWTEYTLRLKTWQGMECQQVEHVMFYQSDRYKEYHQLRFNYKHHRSAVQSQKAKLGTIPLDLLTLAPPYLFHDQLTLCNYMFIYKLPKFDQMYVRSIYL